MKQKINLKRMLKWLNQQHGHDSDTFLKFYLDGSGRLVNSEAPVVSTWNTPAEFIDWIHREGYSDASIISPTLTELLRNLEKYDRGEDLEYARIEILSDGSGTAEDPDGVELFEFESLREMKDKLAELAKPEAEKDQSPAPVICKDCGQEIKGSERYLIEPERHATWSRCEQALLNRLAAVRKIRNG